MAQSPGEIGPEAVILCPIPPATECKSGNFSGLLCCGTITERDCTGPLTSDKKIADLVTAISEGWAFVVISTKKNPTGELCGQIQDP